MKYMRGTGFWLLMQKGLHAKDRKAKKIGKVHSIQSSAEKASLFLLPLFIHMIKELLLFS
jgi:hypothetical protein